MSGEQTKEESVLAMIFSEIVTDAERSNAVTMLKRLTGLDRAGLVQKYLNSNGKKFTEAEATEIYRRGVQEGLQKAEDTQHGNQLFRDVDGRVSWQSMAMFCQQHINRINPRHQQFLNDMAGKVPNDNFGRDLSDKQLAYLKSLYFQAGGKP